MNENSLGMMSFAKTKRGYKLAISTLSKRYSPANNNRQLGSIRLLAILGVEFFESVKNLRKFFL